MGGSIEMDIHVCTTNSLRAGIDQAPSKCHFCGQKTLFFDWVGALCDTCGADIDLPAHTNIRRAREKKGISRKQWAKLTGYAYLTISNYDLNGFSRPYIDKSIKILRKIYSEQR